MSQAAASGRAPGAVLFDLDGTLVDTAPVWRRAYLEVADAFGVELPAGWWDEVRGRGIAASLEVLAADHGPSSGPEAALRERAAAGFAGTALRWLPGARELLRSVQRTGVPTALVTTTWHTLAERILAAGDVRVPVVVGGDDVGDPKPAPDGYLLAARRLGVAPRACLVVEDSPTGVAAAEAAGMSVLLVPSQATVAAARGRTVVASLTAVRPDDLAGMLLRSSDEPGDRR